jgi:hypothetical protein
LSSFEEAAPPADVAGAPPLALGFAEGKGASGSPIARFAVFVAAAGGCVLPATALIGAATVDLAPADLVTAGALSGKV